MDEDNLFNTFLTIMYFFINKINHNKEKKDGRFYTV